MIRLNKKLLMRSFAFNAILICFIPSVFALAMTDEPDVILEPNEVYDKVHKVFLYKRGTLGNVISSDTYYMKLKMDKNYYFWTSIDIPEGWFGLAVTGPGGSEGDEETWQSSDPKSTRKIAFNFAPSADGNYTVIVGSIIATDGGNYQLYVNQAGFAGYWWMILAAVLALILLIFIPLFFIIRGRRRRKRKSKR